MQKAKRSKKGSPGTQPQELSDLLTQALQQPGVCELMAVYERWQVLDNVARRYRQAMGMKRIISASNTSELIAGGSSKGWTIPTWSGILEELNQSRVEGKNKTESNLCEKHLFSLAADNVMTNES
jgi:hypothetical protein